MRQITEKSGQIKFARHLFIKKMHLTKFSKAQTMVISASDEIHTASFHQQQGI